MATGIISSNMKEPVKPPLLTDPTKTTATAAPSGLKTAQPVNPVAAPATTPVAGATQATPATTVPTIAPVKTEVNPETDTVQGQVGNIIKKDSPLMQLAGTRAAQAANARGLLNSSMAVQAGEAAVLDAAMPMATQDAATFTRNRELNQSAENTFRLETGLRDIENTNARLIQSSQNAAAIYQTHSQAVAAILSNPDIPKEQKAELVARQNELLKSGLAVASAVTDGDFSSLLDFKSINRGTTKIGGATYDSKAAKKLAGYFEGYKNGADLNTVLNSEELKEAQELIRDMGLSPEQLEEVTGKKFNRAQKLWLFLKSEG